MQQTPLAVKLWIAGLLAIYAAAKIHTVMTLGYGHYVAGHWPFWAAAAGWGLLALGIDVVVKTRHGRGVSPKHDAEATSSGRGGKGGR